jgi:threonine/homoserine/homoserine lactone efflux protein
MTPRHIAALRRGSGQRICRWWVPGSDSLLGVRVGGASSVPATRKAGVMVELIWSFAPWLVFIVLEQTTSLKDAAACALVVSVIVIVRALIHKHVHLLDVASVVYFVGLLVVVLVADHSADHDIGRYAQAGAHAALTIIVFGSVLLDHPFTESYARETVPREFWHSNEFRDVNRRISLAWGLAFLIGTVSLLIAANTDNVPFLLRIVIPFGALYWAYTVTDKVRSTTATGSTATPGQRHAP